MNEQKLDITSLPPRKFQLHIDDDSLEIRIGQLERAVGDLAKERDTLKQLAGGIARTLGSFGHDADFVKAHCEDDKCHLCKWLVAYKAATKQEQPR